MSAYATELFQAILVPIAALLHADTGVLVNG